MFWRKRVVEEPQGRNALSHGFDPEYYRAANPDVAAGGGDPVRHYFDHGWREGRDPSAHFSTRGYLAANPDVDAAGINPLVHFLVNGLAEGRTGWQTGAYAAPARGAGGPPLPRSPSPRPAPTGVPSGLPRHPWSDLPPTRKVVADALYWLLDREPGPDDHARYAGLPTRAALRDAMLDAPEFRLAVQDIVAEGEFVGLRRRRAAQDAALAALAAAGGALPEPFPGRLRPGDALSGGEAFTPFVLVGWHPTEAWGVWSEAACAVLRLPPAAGDPPDAVEIDVHFQQTQDGRQEVSIFRDEAHVADLSIATHGPGPVRVRLPLGRAVADAPGHLVFQVHAPVCPSAEGRSADGRTLGIGLSRLAYPTGERQPSDDGNGAPKPAGP